MLYLCMYVMHVCVYVEEYRTAQAEATIINSFQSNSKLKFVPVLLEMQL